MEAMNRDLGGFREPRNVSAKFSGDAQAHPINNFDIRRTVISWFSNHLNRAEPWEEFADTAQFSIPKSAQEVTNRIQWNVERFRSNYGILFAVILVGCVMSSLTLMVTIAAVWAMCAALKVHVDDEAVSVLGRKLMLTKNHRQIVAMLVAFSLLYAADIWSAITWSLGVTAAICTIHASVCAELDCPIKYFSSKRPRDLEEGDSTISWSQLDDSSFY
ncbi:hypothetical protein HPB49_017418 [Dermacentor silvarum]|uniref:Uncharacterized protein n=1 Tax=Dermacentor silvarum TaxID=543639 RepID=A0ACB8E1C8_DERSI|nr:hypothetical protein HPB49_017418 [Dermacentor silvarum]